ncbi:hypothetical protein B0G62_10477 [Paraburkholderia eburnea]|uniref:Uncharacterized protein n=1 Tax=Paraburkholderia eburnea TaxID=1189126 RepID=A0A2S4MDE8_9BURK|nr:hypothetical protein [Paraburkholderia eburnea]POR52780.1 hypothetical protein B0G62_10477 [Paraburkholderia eburnea]PRZ23648.1 hypothetical protein BX588_10477 [Paraburkholderia eburnea]
MIDNPLRGMLGGLDIAVNPMLDNVPRMQTSPKFAALMPPEFVAELNDWMLKFFGTESAVYRLPGNRLVMGTKAYAALQRELS